MGDRVCLGDRAVIGKQRSFGGAMRSPRSRLAATPRSTGRRMCACLRARALNTAGRVGGSGKQQHERRSSSVRGDAAPNWAVGSNRTLRYWLSAEPPEERRLPVCQVQRHRGETGLPQPALLCRATAPSPPTHTLTCSTSWLSKNVLKRVRRCVASYPSLVCCMQGMGYCVPLKHLFQPTTLIQ